MLEKSVKATPAIDDGLEPEQRFVGRVPLQEGEKSSFEKVTPRCS